MAISPNTPFDPIARTAALDIAANTPPVRRRPNARSRRSVPRFARACHAITHNVLRNLNAPTIQLGAAE
ncbi:hypothetical protein WL61_20470 [Burkholderia ubonensis]|nr:hypothetical protein WL44_05120 [Burkholderia ubonensis]KWD18755.1 hypothetical protein WL61_20470 [Burkholderia ubonensis]